MLLLSFISTRSMAARPPWLSLKTRSFVTKGILLYYHLPEMLSFTSLLALLQYQQLLVHFAFRIRCALCRRLGCGGGAKALPGQLQRPLRCLLQRQLLLRVAVSGAPAITSTYSPRARWSCSAPPPRRG